MNDLYLNYIIYLMDVLYYDSFYFEICIAIIKIFEIKTVSA